VCVCVSDGTLEISDTIDTLDTSMIGDTARTRSAEGSMVLRSRSKRGRGVAGQQG